MRVAGPLEASPCVRAMAGPPQELEFGSRSVPEILVLHKPSHKYFKFINFHISYNFIFDIMDINI